MKLVIEIDMDNAAFEDAAPYECWRILSKLHSSLGLAKICQWKDSIPLFDINGNKVGQAGVKE